MSQKRSALRTARSRGLLPFQRVDRCSVSCGRQYARRRKKLMKVITYTMKPGILRWLNRRIITGKRFAHGQASVPASSFAALLDEPGSERLMRSHVDWIGCPNVEQIYISKLKIRIVARDAARCRLPQHTQKN